MPARVLNWLWAPVGIAPLVTLRVALGAVFFVATLRFWANGWIAQQYLDPAFHFTYFGFGWVAPLPGLGLYVVYASMAAAAFGITVGLLYRASAVVFWLTFTYTELLDVTYYLNHYYLVSLLSFWLIWVPAHRRASLDVRLGWVEAATHVPRWCVGIFRVQVAIVYVYAGLAKLTGDWLFRAQPLRTWLATKTDVWLLGPLFKWKATAYAFSWFGAVYDLFIALALLWRRTRPWAYAAVVVFHVLTWWLFPIGMFPWVMIAATLVFFPAAWHARLWDRFDPGLENKAQVAGHRTGPGRAWVALLLGLYLVWQLLWPWRWVVFPGDFHWHEQGYRFGWRVMLVEKAGYVRFRILDPASGNAGYHEITDLTLAQQKQLAFQPDLILQYAHHLAAYYGERGYPGVHVYAEAAATYNGRPSKALTNPNINLAAEEDGFFRPKPWILPR